MKKEPFDVGQPFSCGFILCHDPMPWDSWRSLRAWRKELLSLDQRDPEVRYALETVNEAIKEKEST